MSITPFVYQVECLDALQIGLANGDRRQSIVMATGLGKTIAAALALKERLQIMPGRIAIFCHQKHILDQWEKALRLVFGDSLSYGRFHSFAPRGQNAQVMLGLFQSMAHNLEQFSPDHFRHVVVDESHHGPARTYRPTIEHFAPHAQLLGLTATPNRADKKDIAEIFGAPTFELPLELALAKRYLAKVRYLLLADGIQNLDKIPTNVGMLSRTALNRLFFAPERDAKIVELIAEHTAHLGDELRMMVFCRNIAHAERYEQLLPDAWAVHSKLRPHWQDRRIADYLAGDRRTLITVNKFNEGVDYPDTNVVTLLREHGTETGYLQQIGRALRPTPGKDEVLILDVAGNCERLETIVALRDNVTTLYESLNRSSDPERKTPPPFAATIGSFEFDAQVRRVLDVLAVMSGGYNKAKLTTQMLRKKAELGKTPRRIDVERDPSMASPDTFANIFGVSSWNDICEAIGIDPQAPPAQEELVEQLRAKALQLGRAPTYREVNDDPDMESVYTFGVVFGTTKWNAIVEVASLTPNRRTEAYDKEELVRQLKRKATAMGCSPTILAVLSDSAMAPSSAFYATFRTTIWGEVLKAAGLPPPPRPDGDPKQLIVQLQEKARQLGRTPTKNEVEADPTMASHTTYSKHLGGPHKRWNVALETAGLEPVRRKRPHKTE